MATQRVLTPPRTPDQLDAEAVQMVVSLQSRGSVCLQLGEYHTKEQKEADIAFLAGFKSKYSPRS